MYATLTNAASSQWLPRTGASNQALITTDADRINRPILRSRGTSTAPAAATTSRRVTTTAADGATHCTGGLPAT